MKTYIKLLAFLSRTEKKTAILILFLVTLLALFDAFSIASIMPFIALVTNPDLIQTNEHVNYLYLLISPSNKNVFIIYVGLLVLFMVVLSNFLRMLSFYSQVSYSYNRQFSISVKLLNDFLERPFEWFLTQNTSNLSKKLLSETREITDSAILSILNFFSYSIAIIIIVLLLALIDFFTALIVLTIPVLIYSLIYIFVKKTLLKLGNIRMISDKDRFKAVSETLSGVRELNLSNNKSLLFNKYKNAAKSFAKSQILIDTFSQIPRFFIEIVAFGSLIFLIIYLLYTRENVLDILPLIGLYAMAGYRMLPSAQMVYISVSKLQAVKPSIENLYKDIKYKNFTKKPVLKFFDGNKIILKNIYYNYPGTKEPVLKNINMSIVQGQTIGVIGHTGSGKSTLIDIILGLLKPSKGNVKIGKDFFKESNKDYDLKDWHNLIGYVPQNIFLLDDNVYSNIAFGVNHKEIIINKIKKSVQIAEISDFLDQSLSDKYLTKLGERGVRLSGGQIQRIGIARALYHDPSVIVFDEATSALDILTEQKVIKNIEKIKKKLTKIFIAHRLSTLKNCDVIFFIENGTIIDRGNYEYLLKNNKKFIELAEITKLS